MINYLPHSNGYVSIIFKNCKLVCAVWSIKYFFLLSQCILFAVTRNYLRRSLLQWGICYPRPARFHVQEHRLPEHHFWRLYHHQQRNSDELRFGPTNARTLNKDIQRLGHDTVLRFRLRNGRRVLRVIKSWFERGERGAVETAVRSSGFKFC